LDRKEGEQDRQEDWEEQVWQAEEHGVQRLLRERNWPAGQALMQVKLSRIVSEE
jgi:hypothetical protein